MRMSLQYSLVNQVLYAMDATITAKSLGWRDTHILETQFKKKKKVKLANSICSEPFHVIDP